MDSSPSSSSVQGILHARKLEWVAIPFFRVSSWLRDQTQVTFIAGRFLTVWTTREARLFIREVHSVQHGCTGLAKAPSRLGSGARSYPPSGLTILPEYLLVRSLVRHYWQNEGMAPAPLSSFHRHGPGRKELGLAILICFFFSLVELTEKEY